MSSERPSGDVMIVDDTPANLRVLEGILGHLGHRVRAFPSGRLALRSAEASPPDLILLDVSMPEMNGYELCTQLRADERLRGIPVIFISGHIDADDRARAFRCGGSDYVTKPFQLEELQARVELHLELRVLRQDAERLRGEVVDLRARLLAQDGGDASAG